MSSAAVLPKLAGCSFLVRMENHITTSQSRRITFTIKVKTVRPQTFSAYTIQILRIFFLWWLYCLLIVGEYYYNTNASGFQTQGSTSAGFAYCTWVFGLVSVALRGKIKNARSGHLQDKDMSVFCNTMWARARARTVSAFSINATLSFSAYEWRYDLKVGGEMTCGDFLILKMFQGVFRIFVWVVACLELFRLEFVITSILDH